KRLNTTAASSCGFFQVTHKEYRNILYLLIGSGFYFWSLFYFLMENLVYSGSPGLNILYTVLIFGLFLKLIKILRKSS
ncbi:MAG: hypothetical protein ACTSWY_12610, partial [Promethearchaeota archaeon]